MTHRPSTLEAVNKVLTLNKGTQMGFGDKEDILRPRQQPTPVVQTAAAQLAARRAQAPAQKGAAQ